MKGIILAGGTGSRLHPATLATSKQLLPVFDKPMVYYPLSTLLLAGIRDILLVSTPVDLPRFQALLGTGEDLGISLSYQEQKEPKGIAEVFTLAEKFIDNSPIALILGDNLLYGDGLHSILGQVSSLASEKEGAFIFGYRMQDPSRYGVVDLTKDGLVIAVEEKPIKPLSPYAIPGIYFYDAHATSYAKMLQPSKRGELEITDLHQMYLQKKKLFCQVLPKGFAWLDAGTPSALLEASFFVKTMQERQGLQIGCIEEIAYEKGYITVDALKDRARKYNNSYGKYLFSLV